MANIKNQTHSKHSSDEDSSSSSSSDEQNSMQEKQEICREGEEEETSYEVEEQEVKKSETRISAPESSYKRRSQADPNPSSRSKRLKTKVSAEEEAIEKSEEETKKQDFQRVFSEEDEINLLNAMIEYSAKKELDDFAVTHLYDFILKSTNLGVTRTQLKDEIRRLKTKFKNIEKAKCRVSDTHGIFVLCKKLWGEEVDNVEVMEIQEERDFCVKKSGGTLFDKYHGMEEVEIQQGMNMIKGESRKSFEKKWRKVERLEMKAFLLRKQVIVELTELMMKQK